MTNLQVDAILQGDALSMLATLPDACVQTCITSPPYWGLRDYGVAGQMGMEDTPDEWCRRLVAVFREVRRVLRDDGTLWLNLGDSYAGGGRGGQSEQKRSVNWQPTYGHPDVAPGLKPKDLVGIPWMLAFALRADGWYLRSDIIWHKSNPMPESVRDRPTKAHEYLFLLAKQPQYFYDAEAVREPSGPFHAAGQGSRADNDRDPRHGTRKQDAVGNRTYTGFNARWEANPVEGRNKRDVWTIATSPYKGAHFATFPPQLVEPCVLAGSRVGDLVLDPFMGAGTVGVVCRRMNRHYLGIELNPAYVAMAEARIAREMQPMLLYSPWRSAVAV